MLRPARSITGLTRSPHISIPHVSLQRLLAAAIVKSSCLWHRYTTAYMTSQPDVTIRCCAHILQVAAVQFCRNCVHPQATLFLLHSSANRRFPSQLQNCWTNSQTTSQPPSPWPLFAVMSKMFFSTIFVTRNHPESAHFPRWLLGDFCGPIITDLFCSDLCRNCIKKMKINAFITNAQVQTCINKFLKV